MTGKRGLLVASLVAALLGSNREVRAEWSIDKIKGEERWTTSIFASPSMVTDTLVILSGSKPVYISIHEIKENRQRRVQSLSVQTNNPEDE